MEIYTSRITYQGPGRLDITVKTGDPVFAPTWDMVRDIKSGAITVYEYTTMYYSLMRDSYKHNRSRWDELMRADRVVLCCFCGPFDFCHRHLLADILVKCCKALNIPVSYGGEI